MSSTSSDLLNQLISWLAFLAVPLGVICVIDDWFLRAKRMARAATGASIDPTWLKIAYAVLPFAVIAVLWQLFRSQRTDFGFVLVLVTVVSGLAWAFDHWVLRRGRHALFPAARPAGLAADLPWPPEPATVDYARSFFPVAAVLLVLRSFIFEPYRIPSDSMMPTLLDGDFIVVSKYAYGMRLPVIHRKVLAVGSPQRGDVAVFRFPDDLGVNFIKRVVGLPGDRVIVRSDRLIINGEPVPFRDVEVFDDGCYVGMQRAMEKLGAEEHQVLHCLSARSHDIPPGLPSCNRKVMAANYLCEPGLAEGETDSHDSGSEGSMRLPAEIVVPEGEYLMLGDNRDNSLDSRYWGFVREEYLVGRATRIWFNLDLNRPGQRITWSRIGQKIQ